MEDYHDAQRFRAIVQCASWGQIDAVKECIERGYDPNERDYHGMCAVMQAAERNDLEMLRVLHSAGADLNVTFDDKTHRPICRRDTSQEKIEESSLRLVLKIADSHGRPGQWCERLIKADGNMCLGDFLTMVNSTVKETGRLWAEVALSALISGNLICGWLHHNGWLSITRRSFKNSVGHWPRSQIYHSV